METINETQVNENPIQEKVKRNYNRISSDVSKLMQLATSKGFTIKDIALKFECSNSTAKKLLVEPKNCTGFDRITFANILGVDVKTISELID